MDDLKVIDIYNNSNEKKKKDYWKNVDTKLEIKHSYEKNNVDDHWINLMEENVRYIDNILRNPNRFIVNDEEVVKIELARRITVDSIKHLSKNTNFIQEIEEDTGDVKPSKILNINKEESLNTYENRFIYSLIRNMRTYIDMRKRKIDLAFKDRNDKLVHYEGQTRVGKENITVNMMLKSSLADDMGEGSLEGRLERLEMRIMDLMNTDVYKTIDKLRVSLVTSPIKKTNVILKNNNFQHAVKLWNFLQAEMEDKSSISKGEETLSDAETLKELMDETFALNYFILNTIEDKEAQEVKDLKQEVIINNLIQKLIVTNEKLTKKELNDIINEKFQLVKDQTLAGEKEIRKLLLLAINDYGKTINTLKLRRGRKNAKKKKQ
ncbi:MAG: DUF2357 domain-containing protein [Mollicutes bacterium]|nr:DUF2357 domain-containing protein [Mollicutes bacterium]